MHPLLTVSASLVNLIPQIENSLGLKPDDSESVEDGLGRIREDFVLGYHTVAIIVDFDRNSKTPNTVLRVGFVFCRSEAEIVFSKTIEEDGWSLKSWKAVDGLPGAVSAGWIYDLVTFDFEQECKENTGGGFNIGTNDAAMRMMRFVADLVREDKTKSAPTATGCGLWPDARIEDEDDYSTSRI